LSSISDDVLSKINDFVTYCQGNQEELDAYDKKINECKNKNVDDVMSFNVSKGLDTVLNEKTIPDELKNVLKESKNNKAKALVDMLEYNLENIQKKNHNSKFVNAKKRFARKVNTEKRHPSEMTSLLIKEAYLREK
jgi:hypothetical protein